LKASNFTNVYVDKDLVSKIRKVAGDRKLDTRNNRDFGGGMIHLGVQEVSDAI
jgi:hypothetical protein